VALHQCADVLGVKTVDVLIRTNGGKHRVAVEVPGQRELDKDAVNGRVGVEFGDARQDALRLDIRRVGDFLIRRVGDFLRAQPGLRAGVHLVAYINLRSGVFADQNDRQARLRAARGQRVGACLEVGAQLLGQRVSVEDEGGHLGYS